MLCTSLKTAWRHLRQNRSYTLLNVTGLAVGVACVFLIALYIRHELSYDRFHEKSGRIVRMVSEHVVEGERQTYAATPGILAPALEADLPEVERTVRLTFVEPVFRAQGRRFRETEVLYADSTFFEIFDGFRLLHGNAQTALDAPGRVVLSETLARKYFGRTDVVGRALTDRGTPLTVAGVMADVPETSHLQFDGVISLSTAEDPGWWYTNWNSVALLTYAQLRSPDALDAFRAKLPTFMEWRAGEEMAELNQRLSVQAERLTDVYLRSDRRGGGGGEGSVAGLYILGTVAAFVLLIACLNFTNLATARSLGRAREIGVRKTFGASRASLAAQFLAEAVLLSALATVLAGVIVRLARPGFEALAGKALALPGPWAMLASAGALALAAGLLAGAYPAVVLSGFRPAQVLKGRFASGRRGTRLRQGLVVLQLSLTIALVAGAAVVFSQLRYMQNRDLGFDPGSEQSQLLTLDFGGDEAVQERLGLVKTRLARHPAVEGVASSMFVPAGGSYPSAGGAVERPAGGLRDLSVELYLVDTTFVDVYGLEIVAGQPPGAAHLADSLTAYVLNETAVRKAGYTDPEAILGRQAGFWGNDGEVVGVVKDFHTRGLQTAVGPMGLAAIEAYQSVLTLRVRTAGLPETLADLEATWREIAPERPFDYAFLDETFGAQYASERRFGRVVGVFAALAVLVACLGLFGLAAHAAEQRTKEIGVRKVLGASPASIVALLTKDVVKLVGVAFVLSAPVVYVAAMRWLDSFAYHTEPGPLLFLGAGAVALGVAVLTVSARALYAARLNPADALRDE